MRRVAEEGLLSARLSSWKSWSAMEMTPGSNGLSTETWWGKGCLSLDGLKSLFSFLSAAWQGKGGSDSVTHSFNHSILLVQHPVQWRHWGHPLLVLCPQAPCGCCQHPAHPQRLKGSVDKFVHSFFTLEICNSTSYSHLYDVFLHLSVFYLHCSCLSAFKGTNMNCKFHSCDLTFFLSWTSGLVIGPGLIFLDQSSHRGFDIYRITGIFYLH